ncbi:MAG: YihY/virulence factor BrkB family protein, partial [Geminicoccaceae bacterium]|nr:YihY/virulence factor BrkB family protein [Geminicoccaceae bacterium]
GTLATIVAIGLLAVAATTVFAELQSSLNVIWKVQPKATSAPVALVKARLISLSLVVAIGFLLMVSLVISAGLTAFAGYLNSLFPELNVIMRLVNLVISFSVTAILFGLIYKILPETRIAWQDVIVASVTAAFLFTIGKFAIGLYIGSSSVASTYGAAGALVTVLIWVYYSAQILLFGAEMAKSYAAMFGSRKHRRRRKRKGEPEGPIEPAPET